MPIFGVIEITAKTTVANGRRAPSSSPASRSSEGHVPVGPAARRPQYQRGFQTMATSGPLHHVARSAGGHARDPWRGEEGADGARQERSADDSSSPRPPPCSCPSTASPVWRPVPGTGLERVLNTRPLVLRDTASGASTSTCWTASSRRRRSRDRGRWRRACPRTSARPPRSSAKEGVVDLMAGPTDDKDPKKKPSLEERRPRHVVVDDAPTELIVTDGAPDWVPIENSSLVYVKNTTGNVFLYLNDQKTYVLVAGRWFRGAVPRRPLGVRRGGGPAAGLRRDSRRQPEGEREGVGARARRRRQEAVIANEIPQMATIDRAKASSRRRSTAPPSCEPIADTPLSYVVNSPSPIVMVSPSEWYAVAERGLVPRVLGARARGPSPPWCRPSSTRSRRARRCTT